MKPTWPVLLLAALAGGPGWAQERGLLDAPACRRAMEVLEAREAAAARDRSARGALQAAQRQAAAACLGDRDAASAPRRAAPTAVTVTPPRPATPLPKPAVAPGAVPLPVPRAAAALTVTGCDATGCWASDGTRLQRVGPNLLGPQGQTCTSSGTLLHCTR